MEEAILTELDAGVRTITLNRPERRNALDAPSLRTLRRRLQEASHDASVRCVLLTGAGEAFCAGGDVAAMESADREGQLVPFFHELTGEQENVIREVMGMRKPVVAALPGVAAGGGLSLALSADWRIASRSAVLYPAFPALGAVPDGGLTYLLPHFLGIGLAQGVLFSNEKVPAERARDLGLVHEVVDGPALRSRSVAKAQELAHGPTFALGWMKHLLLSAYSRSLEEQLALERRGAVEAAERPELKEGIRAFRERRPPRFG